MLSLDDVISKLDSNTSLWLVSERLSTSVALLGILVAAMYAASALSWLYTYSGPYYAKTRKYFALATLSFIASILLMLVVEVYLINEPMLILKPLSI